jgi:heat shock protein HtpX
MAGAAVWEREIPFVDLSGEDARRRFEDFLVKAMREAYGRYLGGVLNVNYAGMPGLMFYIDDDSGPLLEVLVAYTHTSVRYRVQLVRPFANPPAVERAISFLEGVLRLFAETGGVGVAYFVFVPGRQLVPPRTESGTKRALQSLLLNNLVFLFAISILISYLAYVTLREYAPFALLLAQVPLMLVSYKLVPWMMGDWRIDRAHRYVYLVGLRMPLDKYQEVVSRVIMPRRYEIKQKIYMHSLSRGEEPSSEMIKSVLSEYNILPEDYEIETRKIDLYGIVERVAKSFGDRKIPSIYLSNVVVPNAAASGVGWRLSSVLVTTGLLSRLDDEEIEAVLGHEFSHIARHDVINFFLLSSAEYLSRVFIATMFWPLFATPLGLLYLWFSLTALFIVAKFVEARADLDSALRLGNPEKLASALRKIGFRHLYLESRGGGRLLAWLRWDPHPPLTFRYEKLMELSAKGGPRSPWREAVASCLRDLAKSLNAAL